MESKATLRYNRQSPYKVRKVLNAVRGCNVGTAINYLHFSPEKASVAIEKTIKSAVANLLQDENSKDIDPDVLKIKEVAKFASALASGVSRETSQSPSSTKKSSCQLLRLETSGDKQR